MLTSMYRPKSQRYINNNCNNNIHQVFFPMQSVITRIDVRVSVNVNNNNKLY